MYGIGEIDYFKMLAKISLRKKNCSYIAKTSKPTIYLANKPTKIKSEK